MAFHAKSVRFTTAAKVCALEVFTDGAHIHPEQGVIPISAGIYAAAQLIAVRPEGGIAFGSFQGP